MNTQDWIDIPDVIFPHVNPFICRYFKRFMAELEMQSSSLLKAFFNYQDSYVKNTRTIMEDVINETLLSKGITDYEFRFEEMKSE